MSLYVRESGPANAPTVVFLHGGGVSGWMWRPQVERLADYHCLVPDLPEHGRSSHVKPLTMPGCAEALISLIRERAHGGRAHVVGLSLGAQILVYLLATTPEVIDRAVVSSALVRRFLAPDSSAPRPGSLHAFPQLGLPRPGRHALAGDSG